MTGTGFSLLTVYANFFSNGVSHETCKVCVLLQTIKIAAQHPCGYHREKSLQSRTPLNFETCGGFSDTIRQHPLKSPKI